MPQIHLHAEPGDYAPVVIIPGDPIRATKIAARFDGGLENTRQVNANRGLVVEHCLALDVSFPGRRLLFLDAGP